MHGGLLEQLLLIDVHGTALELQAAQGVWREPLSVAGMAAHQIALGQNMQTHRLCHQPPPNGLQHRRRKRFMPVVLAPQGGRAGQAHEQVAQVMQPAGQLQLGRGPCQPGQLGALPGMLERTVILYTFSKKFAMTGWRLGASIAPVEVSNMIAKLNTNDESCTTHFVQYGGVEGLTGDQSGTAVMLDTLRERRDVAVNMLNAMPGVSVHSPEAAFYLFPDVTGAMQNKGIDDLAVFAEQALHATGVSFCTRRHFGRPQAGEERNYVRFAFSGINKDQIEKGMTLLGDWIKK